VPFVLRYIRFVYQTPGRLFLEHYGNRAYGQWFTTTIFKTPGYEQPALDTAQRETVTVNDLPIAVYIWPGARLIKTSGSGHRRIIHDRKVIKHITHFLKDDH
jgi:hypothetical protein